MAAYEINHLTGTVRALANAADTNAFRAVIADAERERLEIARAVFASRCASPGLQTSRTAIATSRMARTCAFAGSCLVGGRLWLSWLDRRAASCAFETRDATWPIESGAVTDQHQIGQHSAHWYRERRDRRWQQM